MTRIVLDTPDVSRETSLLQVLFAANCQALFAVSCRTAQSCGSLRGKVGIPIEKDWIPDRVRNDAACKVISGILLHAFSPAGES